MDSSPHFRNLSHSVRSPHSASLRLSAGVSIGDLGVIVPEKQRLGEHFVPARKVEKATARACSLKSSISLRPCRRVSIER